MAIWRGNFYLIDVFWGFLANQKKAYLDRFMVIANKSSLELKKTGFRSMKHAITLFVALKKETLI
jgi:hypothetical protein